MFIFSLGCKRISEPCCCKILSFGQGHYIPSSVYVWDLLRNLQALLWQKSLAMGGIMLTKFEITCHLLSLLCDTVGDISLQSLPNIRNL